MKPTPLRAAFFCLLFFPPAAFGSQDDGPAALNNGLFAEYTDDRGSRFCRIDEEVSLVPHASAPDRRLSAKTFQVTWQGDVLIQKDGPYRFQVWLDGQCELQMGEENESIVSESRDRPGWIESRPISLDAGWQPISLKFRKTHETAAIRLFWSGPGFAVEPLSFRFLFHAPNGQTTDDFARGAELVRACRCVACHEISGEPAQLAAPALDRMTETNIEKAWLVDWLAPDPPDRSEAAAREKDRRGRHCPTFQLTPPDAEAVVVFLQNNVSDQAQAATARAAGDAEAGEMLFVSTGCLACHRVGQLGSDEALGGGDLSDVGRKRPPSFFARWLQDPAAMNVDHRMPVFAFTKQQRADLAAYLATLRTDESVPTNATFVGDDDALRDRGEEIIRTRGCAACHRLPTAAHTPPQRGRISLTASSNWENACSSGANSLSNRPHYDLPKRDAAAIRHFAASLHPTNEDRPGKTSTPRAPTAADLIRDHNCRACHARGFSAGLATTARDVSVRYSALASEFAALVPPPLLQIGDKLTEEGLRAAMQRNASPLRPWLRVQMPRFRLEEKDVDLLVAYFAEHDRVPSAETGLESALPQATLIHAGTRLVTGDGFGCTSCHAVGKYAPANAPLNSRGPNLSRIQGRIRPAWFQRWVRDPLRIVSNVEMPAIATPVPGVLASQLDDQIAAVWHTLNDPDFSPPPIEPVRVLRRNGQLSDDAAVLTDVLRMNERVFLKPFVIGLSNRHNVLIDHDEGRLQAWWIGDVASQVNEGKVWYWRAEVQNLLGELATSSDIFLIKNDGMAVSPLRSGQFVSESDGWRHVAGGVELSYRLHFDIADDAPANVIHVRETFLCLPNQIGFQRALQFSGIPDRLRLRVHIRDATADESQEVSRDGRTIQVTRRDGTNVSIRLSRGEGFRLTPTGFAEQITASPPATSLTLDYTTNLTPDRFVLPGLPAEPPQEATQLHVVPGFTATRLPVTSEIMPTGLAWGADRALFVSSLKGRVWRLVDKDDDGLPDTATVFSDELSTPYGLATGNNFVDVINKFALVRLHDDDRDGRAERTTTLASGWGHTDDYHDWVVGLERDEHGNYYVAIPCQQDDRTEAAAYLRGKVLRLIRRAPTEDDPRRFMIEEVSGGHRFPMGIARNRDGALFVTDNQGNYNPFNELNRVISGKRYGFVNKVEQKPGFSPPLTPPAINIPHPWTRSVNGICFLETPPSLRDGGRQEIFGPYTGHLIGCEYDTRRLIRMSLERVGDTYQGAAYPFSYDTPPLGPPLLGPVVCALGPDGALYVGNLRDSGWGTGQNTGNIVRIVLDETFPPPGIAEVRAERDGFAIELTSPAREGRAEDTSNYRVASYRRISTPKYGGDDVDRRAEKITGVSVSADRRTVRLTLKPLRRGFVYEFYLRSLTGDDDFFPAEAYYTLNEIP